ncbi:MAG: TlpA disulfide reductase family protein [Acidobacteriota bacterium]
MKSVLKTVTVLSMLASLASFVPAAPITLKGEISDSNCALSHQKVTQVHPSLNSHSCALACVRDGAKFVFVSDGKVLKIANQDLPALQANAGYTVQVTGDMKDDAITVSKVVLLENHDREPAANFTLTDSNGAKITLASLKGKVVLLNFWATWCGPCQIEIPWFIEFNKVYKSRGLAVVGVSMDEDGWKSVKPYLAAKKIDYPIVIGTEDVAKAYGGIDSLPSTFMIDREGKIAFAHNGLVGKDTYEMEIRSLLGGGKPVSKPAAGH